MKAKIQTTAQHLVSMLVAQDFAGLEVLSRGVRLSRIEMERAIQDYPGTLVMPENEAIPYIDIFQIEDSNPTKWSVDIPLWSKEEGRSDLTLQVTMIESENEILDVEIDDIHVL